MRRLPRSLGYLALALVGVVGAAIAFSALVLPRLLQSQAEQYVADKTGRRLALERPSFNPFTLSLELAGLRLSEADGQPLLAFKRLKVDLSAASLVRRALVFDAIELDEPAVNVVLQRDGRLNWSALLDALDNKQAQPDAGRAPPRLDIASLVLNGGRIDFADMKTGFATRVEPLAIELSDISTLPDDDTGRYKLSATTAIGARVHWQGQATLAPLAVVGTLGVEGLDLAPLAPYLKGKLPVAPPSGVAALSADHRVAYAGGRFDVTLDNVSAKLQNLRVATGAGGPRLAVRTIEARNGRYELGTQKASLAELSLDGIELAANGGAGAPKFVQLGRLALTQVAADLGGHSVGLGRIALKGGRVVARRDARGRIDLLGLADALPRRPAKAGPPAKAGAPWRFRVDRVELADVAAAFRDESVVPAAEVELQDIAVAVDGVSDDLAAALPVRASFRAKGGGSFEAAGRVVPAERSADMEVKLADLTLKPAQPYLGRFLRLDVAGGRLSVDGRAAYGKNGAGFKGGFALRDLRLVESGSNDVFLSWKSLGSREVDATPARLAIGTLALDGLNTQFVINKDKSVNLSRIVRRPEAAAAPEAPAAPAKAAAAAPAFLVSLDRLRISNGELDFADYSLALPFGTRIHHLRGSLAGLSSRPGAAGQVELDGQVDDYGLARAAGRINLFDPTAYTDVKVVFRNVEMTRLTPYSATFAGRRIDSGKLSLDLEYKIDKRQLAGDNQIVMDELTLGERVESPQAKDLPLDLAIAILQDADGRIDLGLPVSGSFDDPQFSYGGIIWKAILNVLGKIATAPFRALGALFGGGETFETIAFEPGAAHLTPPEREKLVRLAGALAKRPNLALTVHGVYADIDRAALQDRQLRRAVAQKAGQQLEGAEDPGPLSTASPKVQAAIEALFADRVGSGELAALKEGFRQANPGQLEEGVAGKMLSRLSGLLQKKRALDEQEVAQLKGADFHALLYGRLRERESVDDAKLHGLAKARGENTLAALKRAGVPAERFAAAAPEKVDNGGRDVPLRLVLAPATKAAAAAGN